MRNLRAKTRLYEKIMAEYICGLRRNGFGLVALFLRRCWGVPHANQNLQTQRGKETQMTKLKTLLMAGVAGMALGAFALPAQAQLGGAVGGAVGGTTDIGGTVNNTGAAASGAAGAAGDIRAPGTDADLDTRSAIGVDSDGRAAASTGINADVNTGAAGIEADATGDMRARTDMDAEVPGMDTGRAAGAAIDAGGDVAAGAASDAASASAAGAGHLQSRLESKGYENVRFGASADGHTSFKARNADGKRVDLVVDSSTGAVVSEEVRSH